MSYISEHSKVFIEITRRTLYDMFGCECHSSGEIVEEKRFCTDKDFVVSILFTGTIQGEYIIAASECTAAKMLGLADADTPPADIVSMRPDFSDALSEALNVIVGESIQVLGKDYRRLTFASSKITFGTVVYPLIPTTKSIIKTDFGEVECHFHLNLMKLNLTTSYNEALENYRSAQAAAEEAKETVNRIMANISSGILILDDELRVSRGHSAAGYKLLGFEPADEPVTFTDLLLRLTGNQDLVDRFVPWVNLVYTNSKLDWHRDAMPLCNCNEVTTKDQKILQFKWLPLYAADGRLDRIMTIVEDITDKRALESAQEKMTQKHERNLELISTIMNLDPEEVMSYIEETREIVEASRKLAKSALLDKEHQQKLTKQVRVVHGSAAEYNFVPVQSAARNIAGELTRMRDGEASKVSSIVIEQELQELHELLSSIEHITERVSDGAKANKAIEDGIRVSFDKIAELEKAILKKNISSEQRSLVESLMPLVKGLRQHDLYEHLDSANSMMKRLASRLERRVVLTYEGRLELDVDIVRSLIEPILQILRNAVEHGLEGAYERNAGGKNPIGVIKMSHEVDDDFVTLCIEDDGRGLEPHIIAQKAVMKEIVRDAALKKMSEQEILNLAFHPAYSSVDEEGGINRGLGLDLVKKQVERLGGVVNLESVPGKKTVVKLTFPASVKK